MLDRSPSSHANNELKHASQSTTPKHTEHTFTTVHNSVTTLKKLELEQQLANELVNHIKDPVQKPQ